MKWFIFIATIILTSSCSLFKKIQREEVIIRYKDSIAWHDSTITTFVTKERYVDIVPMLDTLNLETNYARAQAYLDTTMLALKGYIENKDTTPIKTVIKWKEKTVYKDSIVTKEIPVPYPVDVVRYPKTYWVFMAISIALVAFIFLKIYFKKII